MPAIFIPKSRPTEIPGAVNPVKLPGLEILFPEIRKKFLVEFPKMEYFSGVHSSIYPAGQ